MRLSRESSGSNRSRQPSTEEPVGSPVKKLKLSSVGKQQVLLAKATLAVEVAVLKADIACSKFMPFDHENTTDPSRLVI